MQLRGVSEIRNGVYCTLYQSLTGFRSLASSVRRSQLAANVIRSTQPRCAGFGEQNTVLEGLVFSTRTAIAVSGSIKLSFRSPEDFATSQFFSTRRRPAILPAIVRDLLCLPAASWCRSHVRLTPS